MNKFYHIIICLIIISISGVSNPVYADTNPNILRKGSQQVKVGGNYYTLNGGIIDNNGKLYVPIREFSNILGFPVSWDEKNEIAEVNPNFKKVNLVANNNSSYDGCIVGEASVAYDLGKVILESVLTKLVVFEDDNFKSDLRVSYVGGDENYWDVYQVIYYKGEMYRAPNSTNSVHINKNTGEISKLILTLPDYDEIKKTMDNY